MITHAVGLSLGPTSSVESGIAVKEIASGNLIYVDKLFSMNDVSLFFDNYPSLKNSIICVSLPWDNTIVPIQEFNDKFTINCKVSEKTIGTEIVMLGLPIVMLLLF